MRTLLATLALCLVAAGTGCASSLEAEAEPVALDEAFFRCRVQPILTKSCSMFACHGDARRFFRVYARNRLRLGGTQADRNAFLSPQERLFDYRSAVAMVDPENPEESLLLTKPLDVRAGGSFHRGAEIFGAGDVYLSTDDADYRVLLSWVMGTTDDPECVEPGSDR